MILAMTDRSSAEVLARAFRQLLVSSSAWLSFSGYDWKASSDSPIVLSSCGWTLIDITYSWQARYTCAKFYNKRLFLELTQQQSCNKMVPTYCSIWNSDRNIFRIILSFCTICDYPTILEQKLTSRCIHKFAPTALKSLEGLVEPS